MGLGLKRRTVAGGCRLGMLALAVLWCWGCASSDTERFRVARYSPESYAGRPLGAVPVDPGGGTGAVAVVAGAVGDGSGGATRLLARGQRIRINLMGIPTPMEIDYEIDDRGRVNLVWVGPVKLEGLTTSEAEELIEKTYVQSEVFREVTAIVVAQEDKYFVDGEVKRPGQFSLVGDRTLMMAISAAGGYTEWADPGKIRISRRDKPIWYDGRRIAQGRDEDPLLVDGDIIFVERKGPFF